MLNCEIGLIPQYKSLSTALFKPSNSFKEKYPHSSLWSPNKETYPKNILSSGLYSVAYQEAPPKGVKNLA
jgi:hypothetical protein